MIRIPIILWHKGKIWIKFYYIHAGFLVLFFLCLIPFLVSCTTLIISLGHLDYIEKDNKHLKMILDKGKLLKKIAEEEEV
jgi:hypothetical protein